MSCTALLDRDFRVVIVKDCDELQEELYEVSCFESYGAAVAAWRQAFEHCRAGGSPRVGDVWLIDPDGFEILNADAAQYLLRGPHQLWAADAGRYRFDQATECFQGCRMEAPA